MSFPMSCSSQGTDELASDQTGRLEASSQGTDDFASDQTGPLETSRNEQANPVDDYQRLQPQETQEPRFPTEERQPQLRLEAGAYGGTSCASLFIGIEETESCHVLHQPERGHQTSEPNESCEVMVRGAGQGSTLWSPLPRFLESGNFLFRGMNVPDTERGPNVSQVYRQKGFPSGAFPPKEKERATEHYCDTEGVEPLAEDIRRLQGFDDAILNLIEGRFCCGTYHWKLPSFQGHLADAITGRVVAQFSPPICNKLYGYTFRMVMYLNGVNGGIDSHVSLYVHMMRGEYDERLQWPFTGVITLSILDRSGSGSPNDITKVLTASPNLAAFQKPTAIWNRIGCGFERFAPIYEVSEPRFLKNDTLVIKMEITPR